MDAAAGLGAAWRRWMVWCEVVVVSFLENPLICFYETWVDSFLMTNTNPPVVSCPDDGRIEMIHMRRCRSCCCDNLTTRICRDFRALGADCAVAIAASAINPASQQQNPDIRLVR